MALRKIDLMHRTFAKCEGHTCGECSNLVTSTPTGRTFYKCRAYGVTGSEASDWAKRWQACGLFNKQWTGKPLIRTIKPVRTTTEEAQLIPLDGQMSMEV